MKILFLLVFKFTLVAGLSYYSKTFDQALPLSDGNRIPSQRKLGGIKLKNFTQ